ncbi:MAG: hypothetical protein IKR57_01375 [Bacilli bacterium]|nr:hypothetical protein [Bacilli bacterium]
MKENTLYKITPKLDEIYQKLLKLDKYDFDYSKFKDEINSFDKRLENIGSDSNNVTGTQTLSKPDEKLINELYNAINDFDKFIDKVISSFAIFEHYKDYQSAIKGIKTEEELDKLIEQILNDLLGYIFLIKNDIKENSETSLINRMLYNAIKKEYQLKGNSLIFNTLINNNLNKIINPYLKEDIDKYKNEKDIKDRSKGVLFSTAEIKKIKDLLLLISITDDNYKDGIKHRFDTINLEKKEVDYKINDVEDDIIENKQEINTVKKDKRSNLGEILKTYISLVASIAVLVGAGKVVYDKAKPKTVTYYRLDKECVDTVEGVYDTTTYSTTYDNEVVLKVYSDANSSGQRELTIYVINDRYENINDYLSYEPNEEDLISSKTITDPIVNNKSTEAFKTIEVIKNVDLESKIEKTKSSLSLIGLEAGLFTIWLLLNALMNHIEVGGVIYLFENEFASYEIDELRKLNTKLKSLINKNKKLLEKDEELKNKYNELLKFEEELDNKYKVYLDILRNEIGEQRILKK